jgi:hypothetical protein
VETASLPLEDPRASDWSIELALVVCATAAKLQESRAIQKLPIRSGPIFGYGLSQQTFFVQQAGVDKKGKTIWAYWPTGRSRANRSERYTSPCENRIEIRCALFFEMHISNRVRIAE